jgi:hypothetical protein
MEIDSKCRGNERGVVLASVITDCKNVEEFEDTANKGRAQGQN